VYAAATDARYQPVVCNQYTQVTGEAYAVLNARSLWSRLTRVFNSVVPSPSYSIVSPAVWCFPRIPGMGRFGDGEIYWTVCWNSVSGFVTVKSHTQVTQRLFFFFTARSYAQARSLLWAGVRPSVCLSVTFVHSIQMAENIAKLLCRPGSPIILVFWPPAPIPNSKGNPFSGAAKYKGMRIFFRFSTEIAVYLGNDTR